MNQNTKTFEQEKVKNKLISLEKLGQNKSPFEILISVHDKKLILTDLTYAKFFVYLNKDKIRYNDTQKDWYIWNGTYWHTDEITFHRILEETNNELFDIALKKGRTDQEKDDIKKFAKRYQNDKNVKGMLNCAMFEKEVYTQESYYDKNPGLYNCKNGTIDLTGDTFKFRDHSREDYLTQIVHKVEYNVNAKCVFFISIMNTIFAGNQDVISFIQRALGYTLTGYTNEDCLFFLYGTGRNGKSTFTDIVKEILGDSYYRKVNTESLLLQKVGKSVNNDIAILKGSRLVIGSEIEGGRRLAESLIKDLTGGDDITARFLFKENFTFKPQFKIWIYGNHKPEIRGNDLGIKRRIKLIPFTVTIPENQLLLRDDIMMEIKKELPGILNWILEGFNQYKLLGLKDPEEVRNATNEYFDEMDILKEFINSSCDVETESNLIELKELFNHYKSYCQESEEQIIKTSRHFAKLLRERGYKVTNNKQYQNNVYCYGITKKES